MTCTSLMLSLLGYSNWLTTFFILFVAAVFGASICWLVFEWRYRVGIDYQRWIWARDKLFRNTQP